MSQKFSTRIRRGDIVKVIWNDGCEGPVQQDLAAQGASFLKKLTVATVSTIGHYLKVSHGYLILEDVIHEEADGQIVYEKKAGGKWLSIPLGVVIHVTPVGEILDRISEETKRRRTIFRQLKFIPRTRRLATGEVSRMLYVA